MTTKYITFTAAGNTIITARAISPDGIDLVVNQPIESIGVVNTQNEIQPIVITNTPTFTQPSPTFTPPTDNVSEQPISRMIDDGGVTNVTPSTTQRVSRNPRNTRR